MACVHEMIEQYRPDLELEATKSAEDVVAELSEKSGVPAETVAQVFEAVPDLLFWYLVRGTPVAFPGIGEVRPRIELDGTVRARLEADPSLVGRMSEPDAYRAGINRHENIGLSLERLAQMWNSSHPNDPVQDLNAYALQEG